MYYRSISLPISPVSVCLIGCTTPGAYTPGLPRIAVALCGGKLSEQKLRRQEYSDDSLGATTIAAAAAAAATAAVADSQSIESNQAPRIFFVTKAMHTLPHRRLYSVQCTAAQTRPTR